MKAKRPVKIDVDYSQIGDFSKDPLFYDEKSQEMISYWTDGKWIFWKTKIIINADYNSFVFYNSMFAKDNLKCFLHNHFLSGADPKTFRALNNCYARDKNSIWTTGGKVVGADSESFTVCDDGIKEVRPVVKKFNDGKTNVCRIKIPYGYAKDKNNVYYDNFQGKAKVLEDADVDSFQSLNNGLYAFDSINVYYENKILKEANPQTWRLINADQSLLYSKDEKSVFYLNKIVADADTESFELYEKKSSEGYPLVFGKDINRYFYNNKAVTEDKMDELLNAGWFLS